MLSLSLSLCLDAETILDAALIDARGRAASDVVACLDKLALALAANDDENALAFVRSQMRAAAAASVSEPWRRLLASTRPRVAAPTAKATKENTKSINVGSVATTKESAKSINVGSVATKKTLDETQFIDRATHASAGVASTDVASTDVAMSTPLTLSTLPSVSTSLAAPSVTSAAAMATSIATSIAPSSFPIIPLDEPIDEGERATTTPSAAQ